MLKPLGAVSRGQVEGWPPVNPEDPVGAQGQKVTLVPVFLILANKVQSQVKWGTLRWARPDVRGALCLWHGLCLSGLTREVSIYEFSPGQTALRSWIGVGWCASLWQACVSAWAVWGCTGSCPHQTWWRFYCILHSASASFPDLLPASPRSLHEGPSSHSPFRLLLEFLFLLTLEIPLADPALAHPALCPARPSILLCLVFSTVSYGTFHQIVSCLSPSCW